MPRTWLILFLLVITGTSVRAAGSPIDSVKLYKDLQQSANPTARVAALLALGDFYLSKPLSLDQDYQKAEKFLREAVLLSSQQKLTDASQEANLLLGLHARKNDTTSSKKLFMDVVEYYHRTGNKQKEALAWYKYGLSMAMKNPFSFSIYSYPTVPKRYLGGFTDAMSKAATLSRQINNKALEALAHVKLSYAYISAGQSDKAELEARIAMALHKQTDTVKKFELNHMLMYINLNRNRNDSSLYYGLESLKSAEETKHEEALAYIYVYLGFMYHYRSDFPLSIQYFEKYFTLCEKYKAPKELSFLRFYTGALIRTNRLDEAEKVIKSIDTSLAVYGISQKSSYLRALASLSLKKKNWVQAEEYYIQITNLNKDNSAPFKLPIYIELAEIFVTAKQYDKARSYLKMALDSSDEQTPLISLRAVHKYLFHIDTAQKKYPSAISHMLEFMRLKDSIYAKATGIASSELLVKYETEKKEKNILALQVQVEQQKFETVNKERNILALRLQVEQEKLNTANNEKNIRLLNAELGLQHTQAELKEKDLQLKSQNISLLKKENQFQSTRLSEANTVKLATIAGSILLIIISLLLYHQYRVKKRSNLIISRSNTSLQQLVKEKELLVTEIHHRVKNNLQTVVSLLESQSAYLQDDALLALQDSQNRVHAMSLIHQTLYQGDKVSVINMSTYLPQMVNYLKEVFNAENIRFTVKVDPVELDVSQAVPVGLILNEAVTNSIKYAFTNTSANNEINVQLQQDGDQVQVRIKDNGTGIADFNYSKGLGLKLMKGLAGDLDGNFAVKNDNGTEIRISFSANTALYKKVVA